MAVRYGTVRKYGTVRIYFGQKVQYASTVRNIHSSTAGTVRGYAIEMCVSNVSTYRTKMAIFRVSKCQCHQKY